MIALKHPLAERIFSKQHIHDITEQYQLNNKA